MTYPQTRNVRMEAARMLFRATTELNIAALELTDESVPARECHRIMLEATNLINEALGVIKRTFP